MQFFFQFNAVRFRETTTAVSQENPNLTTAVDSSNVVDDGVVVDVVGDGSSNRTLDSGDEDRLVFRPSGLGLGLGLDSSFRLSFRDEKSGARCSMGGGPDLFTISRELSEVNPAPALASLKANMVVYLT